MIRMRSSHIPILIITAITNTAGTLGVPLIDGAVAALECRVVAQQVIGTHTVFFGEVVAVTRAPVTHMPLLYCKRDYGQFLAF